MRKGRPPGTGQLIIAIDPAAFPGGLAHFACLAGPRSRRSPATRLPGARRRLALRAKAQRDGLGVSDALLREIEAL